MIPVLKQPVWDKSQAFYTKDFGHQFLATVDQLFEVLGLPDFSVNSGKVNINYNWIRRSANGYIFNIYDWKQNRPIDSYEFVEWFITSHSEWQSIIIAQEILTEIEKLP